VNTKDPILKPWAAKQMQETNDELLNGKRKLPFVANRAAGRRRAGQLLFSRASLLPSDAEGGVHAIGSATALSATSFSR